MKSLWHHLTLAAFVTTLVFAKPQAVGAGVLFAPQDTSGANDSLISLDPSTALGTAVGELLTGQNTGIVAMAFDSNTNTLYGTNNSTTELLRINQETGAASVVGTTLVTNDPFGRATDIAGLAFDSVNNILYGLAGTADFLVKIDVNTGGAFAINDGFFDPSQTNVLRPFTSAQGLAFDPNQQILYATNLKGAFGELFTIDVTSGRGTLVNAITGSALAGTALGLAFDPSTNTLYGVIPSGANSQLVSINTATAEATVIGLVGHQGLGGLAFGSGSSVPEPSTLPLIGLGMLGLAYRRGRGKQANNELRRTSSQRWNPLARLRNL